MRPPSISGHLTSRNILEFNRLLPLGVVQIGGTILPRMPYLQKNARGTFRVRREIPEAARYAFDGKTWFIKSLGTKDAKQADERAIAVLAEFQEKVDRAVRGEVFWVSHDTGHYERAFFQWHGDEQAFYDTPHRFESRQDFVNSVTEFVHENGLAIRGRDLADFVQYIEGSSPGIFPPDNHVQPASGPRQSRRAASAPRTSLSELRDRLITYKSYAARTENDVKYAFNFLIELVGDIPVNHVTGEQIREFRDALLAYPVKGRTADVRRLTIRQVIKQKWEHTLSPVTVRKLIGFMNQGFELAVSEGWTVSNPVAGIKVPTRTPSSIRTERTEFRPGHLTILFSSPLFTGCKSASRVREPGSVQVRDHRFWLPWLGLFTGARLGELVQLETTNVKCDSGVWFIEITTVLDQRDLQQEKHVKTEGSRRVIPLHARVIELGFPDHVEKRGSGWVFPNDGGPDHLAREYSKRFGAYLDDIGLVDRALVFHSFRHNFKTACRMANIPAEIHDELTGHAPQNVGGIYGERKRLMTYLNELVDRIQYEGLPR